MGAAVLTFASTFAVDAQTVDYTAAEAMFGEPVTATAIGKPQRASEAPANIQIIGADDIRRSGATDLPSLLRFVPGVNVKQYGQFDTAVGIRGYNTPLNPRVLVLLDGRQVYQDDYGYTLWSQIPVALSEIRQIEIVKGPNAALFGFNAVSGVINIVTFDPLRDRKNAVSVAGGTQHQVYGEAVATVHPSERFGIRVSAKGTRTDEFDAVRLPDSNERPSLTSAAADARFRLTDRLEVGLSASAGRIETNLYPDMGLYLPLELASDSIRAVVTADSPVGLLQFDAYRNATDLQSQSLLISPAWSQAITVLKASDLVRLGSDHTVRLGAEYRHSTIESDRFFGGEMTSDVLAGSAMWTWQIRPDLSLTNAVRLDGMSIDRDGSTVSVPDLAARFGDRSIVEPSFNSALLYSPTDFDTFRLTAARAVQLPSLVSLGLFYATDFAVGAGTTDLDPSGVYNVEAGYSRELPRIGSRMNLSVFAQETDKTIGSPFASAFGPSPDGRLLTLARNFDGTRAAGGEIEIEGANAAGWRWNLSYAVVAIDDLSSDDILRNVPWIDYSAQTPVHSLIAGLGYARGPFEVDAKVSWQSRHEDVRINLAAGTAEAIDVPDYVTLNARVAYRLSENATISLTGEQLNAARIVTSAGPESERRVLAGFKLEF